MIDSVEMYETSQIELVNIPEIINENDIKIGFQNNFEANKMAIERISKYYNYVFI